MNEWKRFSRRDCPICNGARNDCRQNLISTLIHCRDSEANPPDYVFRGIDSLGFGMWALQADVDAWAEEKRREWQEERHRQRELQEIQRRQKLLTESDRHREICKILNQLNLTKAHRQALRERGMTDAEIEGGMYRSVVPWQKLNHPVNDHLAGVQKDGKSLHIHGSGILCPISNQRGEFVGWQVRLDEPAEGAKYLWAASESTRRSEISVHLPNGELPLAFYEPKGLYNKQEKRKQGGIENPTLSEIHPAIADTFPNKIPVALTEGVSFKPAITAQRLGIHTIGASGGNFASSRKTLVEYLNAIEIKTGAQVVPIIFADAGSTDNPSVIKAYQRTAEILKEMDRKAHVAWWGQTCKEDGDIDEVSDEVLSNLRLLPYEDFSSLVKKNHKEKEIEEIQQRLRNLTYIPNLKFEKRYLPNLVGNIPSHGIVALKSPKNTGKSFQIKLIIEQMRSLGFNVISITPRRALGREQALKWEIEWAGDADISGVAQRTVLENLETLGLCWDSLWKLMGRDWSRTLIVVDESELAIAHLLLSSTCKEKRPAILRTLERKLQECLTNGGMLLIADADMTDLSIDYFRSLAPSAPTFVVVNEYSGEEIRWQVEYHTGKKDVAITKIMTALALPVTEKNGSQRQRRLIIPTDSQDEAEALERSILERYPHLITVRIDSTTTETAAGREFVENPNEKIEEIGPDVLIHTNSMGTGVSIDISWFDEVHALFMGVIEPSQCRQMLGRVREPVPRFIWCRKMGRLENCKSFFPNEIKSYLFSFHRQSTILIDVAQAIAGDDADDTALLEVYQSIWDNEIKAWNNPHLDLYSNLVARRNYGMYYLSAVLYRELLQEGHLVKNCDQDFKSSEGQRVKEIKRELNLKEAVAIAKAEDISLEMAQLLKQRSNLTQVQRHQITKALLKAELPGVKITPEFIYKAVTKDKRKWLNAQKLYWYVHNPDKVKVMDQREWVNHLWQCLDGIVFLPDIRTYSLQVKIIHDLQLFEVIDLSEPHREYTMDDQRIQKLMSRARKQAKQIYTGMNLKITKKTTPIKFINALLARVGLLLNQSRQTHDGKRFYKLNLNLLEDCDRLAVLDSLNQKWAEIASKTELQTQQEKPISNIKYVTSCDPQEPDFTGAVASNRTAPSPVNQEGFSTIPEAVQPYIFEICRRLDQGARQSVQAFSLAIASVKKFLYLISESRATMILNWLQISLSDWLKAQLREYFPGEIIEIVT